MTMTVFVSWIPSLLFSLALLLDRSQFLETSLLSTPFALWRFAENEDSHQSSQHPAAEDSRSTATRTNTDIIISPTDDAGNVLEDALLWTLQQESKLFREQIRNLVSTDPSLAGPLVRLAFHDAATRDDGVRIRGNHNNNLQTGRGGVVGGGGGPNGSIRYELERSENRGLAKPLKVVQDQYSLLLLHNEKRSILSLADAIALAGAQAFETVGGPSIRIRMGRPDATTADAEFLQRPLQASTPRSLVTTTLPSAGLDSDGLRLYFGRVHHLTEPEWIALTGGSHGLGRHVSLLGMPKDCLKNLTRSCLEDAPVLLPFVTESVNRFDNTYFQALLAWNAKNQIELGQVAFIPTDVDMVVDPGLRRHVQRFAKDDINDDSSFRRAFVRAYQKLVETTATTKERY